MNLSFGKILRVSLFIINIVTDNSVDYLEVPMRREEINLAIKTVFSELYKIVGLYEITGCYNCIPGQKSVDVWKYMERKILVVRRIVDSLLLGEEVVSKKLHRIIDETEHFVKCYERPGTVIRWKQINPKLLFFDCAFDLMEQLDKDVYLCMQRGLTNTRLSLYPDEKLIMDRKRYFQEIYKKNQENNLQYSEERIFQNEMHNTLKLVFENDLKEYLE